MRGEGEGKMIGSRYKYDVLVAKSIIETRTRAPVNSLQHKERNKRLLRKITILSNWRKQLEKGTCICTLPNTGAARLDGQYIDGTYFRTRAGYAR